MGPLLPNPGTASGVSRWDMDPQAYASNKKASWEGSDFESLFDRRTMESVPDATVRTYAEEDSSVSAPGKNAPDAGGANEYRPSTVADAFGSGGGDAMRVATSAVADAADLRESAGAESVQSGMSLPPAVVFSSDAMTPDDSSGARAIAQRPLLSAADEVAAHPNRVTVATDGTTAHVWIRDAAIPMAANADIESLLRVRLSWLGVALASLKINGRGVQTPFSSGIANRSLVADVGSRQQNQRVLTENGYGG